MTPLSPITDDDIEDFISDRLPDDRRRAVEDFLSATPARRAEIQTLIDQQEALRRLGADLLEETVPDRFLRLLADDTAAPAQTDDQKASSGS